MLGTMKRDTQIQEIKNTKKGNKAEHPMIARARARVPTRSTPWPRTQVPPRPTPLGLGHQRRLA